MGSDSIIFAAAVIDLCVVLLALRLGKEWIYATIGVNLILVSTFGSKLIGVTPFDFITNAGNVFYAVVFFAVHVVTEHFGKKAAFASVGFGAFITLLYVTMSQMTLNFPGIIQSNEVNEAIRTLFASGARLSLASLIPFVIIQIFNIWLYDALHRKTGFKYLWLRDNATNILGQLCDSLVFFSIAFFAVVPREIFLEILLVGFALKVLVGVMGTPLLYLSYRLRPKSGTIS